MNTVESIQAALQALRGLPMWEAGWAGDIAWFQFGAQVKRPDRGGRDRLVGEYALHVSCPWRWSTTSGFVRADETSDQAALQALRDPIPHFTAAARAPDEVLMLRFDNGDTLAIDDVGVATNSDEDVECWRLFQPGLKTPHLIVTSAGVEWHEA